MTVERRLDNLLLRTVKSLEQAGFNKPRLFIDGAHPYQIPNSLSYLEATCRFPKIKTVGNWMLSMWELYLRDPTASHFALFQDDIIAVKNLREYLDKCEYPNKGYWNLYSMPGNLMRSGGKTGWCQAARPGKGALGIVLSREALLTLFAQQYFLYWPQNPHRGTCNIDGVVCDALNNAGWKEYVHSPSLLQHTGYKQGTLDSPVVLPISDTFPGEEFDALSLLQQLQPQ
jgi:hypothetical protein